MSGGQERMREPAVRSTGLFGGGDIAHSINGGLVDVSPR
jgi:hypothetical protein